MVLGFHIATAILSIIVTALALARPSRTKLFACYALAGSALSSGTYMIMTIEKSIVSSCIAGITYFAIASVGIYMVRKKVLTLSRV